MIHTVYGIQNKLHGKKRDCAWGPHDALVRLACLLVTFLPMGSASFSAQAPPLEAYKNG